MARLRSTETDTYEDEQDFSNPGEFLAGEPDPSGAPPPPVHYEPPPGVTHVGGQARNTAANNNDSHSPGAFATYDEWAQDFLRGNPGDEHRLAAAYAGHDGSKRGDDPAPQQQSSSSNSSSSSSMAPRSENEIMGYLRGLFPGGAMNKGIVAQRTDNVRDTLNRQRTGQLANQRAVLAERGLIGDGPEGTAFNNLEGRIADTFAGEYGNIWADESENADARMMQALQLAGGIGEGEADRAIDRFRAETEHDLGFGQLSLGRDRLGLDSMLGQGTLALGNLNAVNDANLGLGRLGLDRDRLLHEIESGDTDRLIEILKQILGGADISAGGYI